MPHATDTESYNITDVEGQVEQTYDFGSTGLAGGWEGDDKDADAQDYEDISDDDLPEEEEATNHLEGDEAEEVRAIQAFLGNDALPSDTQAIQHPAKAQVNGHSDDHAAAADDIFGDSLEDNDLFGERLSVSPVAERHATADTEVKRPGLALPGRSGYTVPTQQSVFGTGPPTFPASPPSLDHGAYSPDEEDEDGDDFEHIKDPTLRAQMRLFKISKLRMQGEEVDWDPVKTQDENKFWQQFPTWEADEVPRFCELLPPVPGRYRRKVPFRAPKALHAVKPTLDLMPDQEKSFKAAASSTKVAQDTYNGREVIRINESLVQSDESDVDFEADYWDPEDTIGGVSMRDLAMLCQDWEVDAIHSSSASDLPYHGESPRKRQRLNTDQGFAFSSANLKMNLDDPEAVTAKIARNVRLDMNDEHLLLDEQAASKRRKIGGGSGALSNRDIMRRYNISNDEAYDLLKENQHKVRSTLGNMDVEHSLPAARLQWPFYKVALDDKEKRAFHRPRLNLFEPYGRTYRVHKPRHLKRKNVRGREAKELFARSEDLSLGDNSNVLMLEYSEEMPTTLSNFGMGNRLINYYRKRNADDQERPKREIGETQVLLLQDKSPFANFGHVDEGETVPVIQNGLYRAPIFQHEPRSSDFVMVLSHTYESGARMFLKNTENLHTVGQQLPVAEVPGEHSRKVTDAAKKRLRAISYRIYSKSMDPIRRGIPLTNAALMRHTPGSDLPQTRSKMREFMKYEKKAKNSGDDGNWVPPPGQVVPDEDTIRTWIRPEDICLLDSTQVGVQHLHDLGISTGKHEEENEDEDLEEGAHIEKKLAPWQTTKNFLFATQGKAMLQLHGEGDPTGRGQAFSFIRTSMKGGYIAEGESAAEKIKDHARKEQGGHKYNVATQQAKYDSSIRLIWDRQKAALSNNDEISDTEMDEGNISDEEGNTAATPRANFGTPMGGFDDSASQFSRHSVDHNDEVLIIKRRHRDAMGNWKETPLRIDNPKVIKLYQRRKQEAKLAKLRFEQHPRLAYRFMLTSVAVMPSSSRLEMLSLTDSRRASSSKNLHGFNATLNAVSPVRSSSNVSPPSRPVAQVHYLSPRLLSMMLALLRAKLAVRLDRRQARLLRQAKGVPRMVQRGSAPTVVRLGTSRPTESQSTPPLP